MSGSSAILCVKCSLLTKARLVRFMYNIPRCIVCRSQSAYCLANLHSGFRMLWVRAVIIIISEI